MTEQDKKEEIYKIFSSPDFEYIHKMDGDFAQWFKSGIYCYVKRKTFFEFRIHINKPINYNVMEINSYNKNHSLYNIRDYYLDYKYFNFMTAEKYIEILKIDLLPELIDLIIKQILQFHSCDEHSILSWSIDLMQQDNALLNLLTALETYAIIADDEIFGDEVIKI